MKSMTRRDMMGRASRLGGTLAVGATAKADDPPGPGESGRKLKVVVTGGHPGDPEYGCGGTVARYTDLGHEVVLLYLNDGEPPNRPPPGGARGARVAEAARACEILKARP